MLSTKQMGAERITAAGMTREVTFEPIDGAVIDRIDDAYRPKYKGTPYLTPMIGARARSATVRIVPRDTDAPGRTTSTEERNGKA